MATVNGIDSAPNYFSPAQEGSLPQEGIKRADVPPPRGPVRRDSLSAVEADQYVNRAVEDVRNAYRSNKPLTPPALAATEKLVEVTNSQDRRYVTPEIAARIFQGLRTDQQGQTPSTMDRIIADLGLTGDGHRALLERDDPRTLGPGNHPTYDKVIRNLSVAMDNMARAQNAGSGQYLSPQIEAEVRYIGRALAERIGLLRNPHTITANAYSRYESRFDNGFAQAASEGSAVLALETARQLAQPSAPFAKRPPGNWDPRLQAGAILDAVREGTQQYHTKTQEFFASVHQNLAPVLAPLNGQGANMTEEQQRAGVANVFKTVHNGDKLLTRIQNDRREVDTRGYQLLRFGETIGFYKNALQGLEEYGELKKARSEVLTSTAGKTMLLLSQSATREITDKIGLGMPEGRYFQGHLGPTKWGLLAQAADFAEYWLETYNLKQPAPPNTPLVKTSYGTYGSPDRSVTRLPMPRDVAGMERWYSVGEYRQVPPGASRLDPGVYAINPKDIGVKHTPFEPTRMGAIPKLGLGVWAAGGIAQAALTKYIIDEVGFDEGQEFRKVLLVGLVGGFAGFHLLEAGMAGARVMSDNQPWTRFSVSGTTAVTGSLAGLMTIATAWDMTGVYYNATAASNPDQGWWGSPQWKAGTHAVNLLNDGLLLRLQTREFAKRILPTLIDRYGAESLQARAAMRVATSKTLSYVATRFILSENPIGATVNVLYGGTAICNYVVDRNRYVRDMQAYDNAFLQGAGVNPMQAEVLAERSFANSENRSTGFNVGYQGVSAPPEKYVEYVNSITNREELEELLNAARKLPQHMERSDQPGEPDRLKQSDPNTAYYALPKDEPGNVDLSRFPTIHFNTDKQRFEDSATGLYYDPEAMAWRREDHRGNLGFYYYPSQQFSEEYAPKFRERTDMAPSGVDGWKAFLNAREKMPPQ